MPKITLTVNNEPVTRDVEARTLLSELIREELKLTGTHIGCDTSQCGACTVQVNGQPVKSCSMLAVQANGADVLTIEGHGDGETLTPLQNALHEHHGLQCGFCTPGMVLTADALLRDNPDPSEEDIRHELEGNICRCTGYQNIVEAVLAAAKTMRG
ncbi:MAG: (2Fe-2S)-binding protein [Rhodospirillales bacterium]|nr:(2Fe-2S)-binding protein [Alphaproteobacteria bacterium]MBL6948739.1 (2Fe-2S)-binding protein [Rhodospirillales bacterium]